MGRELDTVRTVPEAPVDSPRGRKGHLGLAF